MRKLLVILGLLFSLSAHAQFCGYTFHAPISMSGASNITISGDSITSINLTSCTNVHITKCKVCNNTTGTVAAINLSNCTNVTIDSCFITNDLQGIYAHNCTTVKVNNNYFLNIIGDPAHTWHPIQFDNVSGGGQQINDNKIEEIGVPYTHDQISVFGSTGAIGDSIQVFRNSLRGGQTQMNGTGPGGRIGGNNGACGIGVDIGTTYCSVRGNKLINTGYAGIQIIGSGIDKCTIDHNYVYSSSTNISLIALSFSASGYTSMFVGYNHLSWLDFNNHVDNLNPVSSSVPGWSTNTAATVADPLANASMIPNPQVTPCATAPSITYASPQVYSVGQVVSLTPTNTGGTATGWTCSPTLPVSLSINSSTGIITGTLTATHTIATYTVTASNVSGNGTFPLIITVIGSGGNLFFGPNGKLIKKWF